MSPGRWAGFILLGILVQLLAASNAHKVIYPFGKIAIEKIRLAASDSDFVQVSVAPLKLQKSGDWVTVRWTTTRPGVDDAVLVYSPASAALKPSQHAPVKYKAVSEVMGHQELDTYLKGGKGVFQFSLLNMRSNYAFAFLQDATSENPSIANISMSVEFENYNEPLQGHLSLTNNHGEMRVSWASLSNAYPQVRYGLCPVCLNRVVKANSETYTRRDLCGYPGNETGWRDPGLLHSAVMTNLSAATTWFYSFGSLANGWSEVHSFKIPPARSPDAAISVFAFGDMGKGEVDGSNEHWCNEHPSLMTTRLMQGEMRSFDMVLHIGDISYAVGYSSQWDEFMQQIEPLARSLPYQTLLGNHEFDFGGVSRSLFNGNDSGGECGVPFAKRFPLPSGLTSPDVGWYSFDVGSVHVIMMSTEHAFEPGSAQFEFIVRDLNSVDRTLTPWLVFAGHRPMYIDSTWPQDLDVADRLQATYDDLFFHHQVDLALWGHHHSFQRTCHVHQGRCVDEPDSRGYRAPIHAIIGMAGMELTNNIRAIAPEWIAYTNVHEYGYSRLHANSSHLWMEFVSNQDGGVRHSFHIGAYERRRNSIIAM